jgi:hypothetical protein
MFVIMIVFALASGDAHGQAVSHERFATLAACEVQFAPMVEGFRRAVESEHGPVNIEAARCVRTNPPADSEV